MVYARVLERWFPIFSKSTQHALESDAYLSADVFFASYKLWSCVRGTTTAREQVTVHATLPTQHMCITHHTRVSHS